MNFKTSKIKSIEFIGYKDTIDIEVSGNHLFYCNDILTHNSAAGDVAEVTEESIQGGISKIQSADNVFAIIPDSSDRKRGLMRMKLLKTRDSGGVDTTVFFETDWETLSFVPCMHTDEMRINKYCPTAYNYLKPTERIGKTDGEDLPFVGFDGIDSYIKDMKEKFEREEKEKKEKEFVEKANLNKSFEESLNEIEQNNYKEKEYVEKANLNKSFEESLNESSISENISNIHDSNNHQNLQTKNETKSNINKNLIFNADI